MAKQDIVVGSAPDAGVGEILFDAFSKCVNNFNDNYRDIAILLAAVDSITPAATFNMVAADDSLVAIIAEITGVTYVAHKIVVDDDTEPLPGAVGWVEGGVVATKTVADWLLHKYYLWVRQVGDTVIQIRPLESLSDLLPVPGLIFQARALSPPVEITAFAVNTDGVNDAAEVNYLCPATTIVDNVALTYDLYNLGIVPYALLEADITPGVAGTYSSLTADSSYQLAVIVYPEGDLEGVDSPRASVSNIEPHTTGTIGSITSVTVNDSNDTTTAVVILVVDDADLDEVYLSVDDGATPSGSEGSGWVALSGWTESPALTFTGSVDVGAYGTHEVHAWVRDATYPTAITEGDSDVMVATDTGAGVPVHTFSLTDIVVDEEGATAYTFSVERSGNVSSASTIDVISSAGTENPAVAGDNYQPVSKTLSFATSATQATFTVQLLWANLGHDYRMFVLTLSNASAGTIANASVDVRINGTYGYLSYHPIGGGKLDIDLNHPPTNLTKLFGRQVLSGGTETFEYKDIDATGADEAIYMKDANNKTIENVVLYNSNWNGVSAWDSYNLKFRNCYIHDTNKTWVPRAEKQGNRSGDGIFIYRNSGNPNIDGFQILGNKYSNVWKCNGVSTIGSGAVDVKINWNHMVQGKLTEFKDEFANSMLGHPWTYNMEFPEHIGNNIYAPLSDYSQDSQDFINTYTSGCADGKKGKIWFNHFMGNTPPNKDSSAHGIILSDGSEDNGNWDCRFNVMLGTPSGAISTTGGRNNTVEYNDMYKNIARCTPNPHAAGLGAGRAKGCHSGNFYGAISRFNRILWFQDDGTPEQFKQNKWYAPNGPLYWEPVFEPPNHGTPAGTPSTYPTGWFSNYDMDGYWGSGAGEFQIEDVKAVLRQPAYGDGVYVMYASPDARPGDGTLVYDHTNQTMKWAEYADSFGEAVDLTAPQMLFGVAIVDDPRFRLTSGSGEWIYVCIYDWAALALLTSGQSWTIKPTKFKKSSNVFIYPGPFSDWSGFDDGGSAPTDTDPPNTVTGLSSSAVTTTTITLTWDQTTDVGGSGVDGYNLYARNISTAGNYEFVATIDDSASPSYQRVGLTPGDNYEHYVVAFDLAVPPNYAAASQTYSVSTNNDTYDILGTEFEAGDLTHWSPTRSTLTNPAGLPSVGEITNTSATQAGIITQSWLTGGSTASLDWSTLTRAGLSVTWGDFKVNGRLVIDSTGTAWEGDILTKQFNVDGDVWTPSSGNVLVSPNTTYYITVWTNSSVIGDKFQIDELRITELGA